jgi:epoxyqueuosine reductase
MDYAKLAQDIKAWGREAGFQAVGIADADLAAAEPRLLEWLSRGWHGEMEYMARHGALRARPAELKPGTLRVVSCRMDYAHDLSQQLPEADGTAYIARYARGRDYHKVVRARLQRLSERIEAAAGPFGYRVFSDSAPVMEVELAARAGLGWRGKHTLLLSREAGSWFFLGEIYCDLPLPTDAPEPERCGSCTRCIDVCPTGAIRAPYQLDARRCISYLTIEHKSAIPEELRPLIGNRVYGCDDCQIACPWNGFAKPSGEGDFQPRHGLDAASLVELFGWSEAQFDERMRGSAIRRIGYERWLRNLAVGLGNAPSSPQVLAALRARADYPSALVREHVAWALCVHGERAKHAGVAA